MGSNSKLLKREGIQSHHRLVVLLAIGSLTVMPGAVIAPVLPEIIRHLQLDQALAGYLVSAHYLTVALMSPVLGLWANRLGLVRVLVGSACCFAIAGLAGSFTTSFGPMLVTRGLLGAATGGIAAATLGLLATLYRDESDRAQAIAYASGTLTLANIVYPLLSGWVGAEQWQVSFYLYGFGLPLAGLAALVLPDRPSPTAPPSTASPLTLTTWRQILRHPPIPRLLLTTALSAAIAYATVIYVPLYLSTTLHTNAALNGLVLAAQALGAAIVSAFGVHWLLRRFRPLPTLLLGLSLMTLALCAIPQIPVLYGLILILLIFGTGMGISLTSHYTTLANLAPAGCQTPTLALTTGMNFLGQFLSPILFGLVVDRHALSTVFYAVAAVAVVTGILLVSGLQRSRWDGMEEG